MRFLAFVCAAVVAVSVGISGAFAQAVPSSYPKNVDLGVQGITLNFRMSSEEVLGHQLVLAPEDSKRESVRCLNAAGSEELTLIRFVDRGKNSFQQFRVRAVADAASSSQVSCRLPDVTNFETFRKIRIGMSVSELTEILGDQFSVDAKGSSTTIMYSIDTNLYSSFLQHYGELKYGGRYTFRNGKLIDFWFGFDL